MGFDGTGAVRTVLHGPDLESRGPDRPNYVQRLGRGFAFLAVLGLGLIVTTGLAGFGTFGRHNSGLGVLSEVLAVLVNIAVYSERSGS